MTEQKVSTVAEIFSKIVLTLPDDDIRALHAELDENPENLYSVLSAAVKAEKPELASRIFPPDEDEEDGIVPGRVVRIRSGEYAGKHGYIHHRVDGDPFKVFVCFWWYSEREPAGPFDVDKELELLD